MNSLAARGDVTVVRRQDLPALSNEDFHDFTHVRASGRRLLSERLAQILARVEGGDPTPASALR
jgi:hypothetical protein